MKHVCSFVVGAVLVLTGTVASAQSLADVARKEQERRKAVKDPARVYTDADVQTAAPLTTAAARPQAEVAKDGVEGEAKAASATTADAKTAKAAPADEAAWRGRLTQAREDLARSQRLLSAMEQQLVTTGIQNANAAATGQAVPNAAREQESAKEVQRLRADIEKQTTAIAQIEADAREAGVPPGWVR